MIGSHFMSAADSHPERSVLCLRVKRFRHAITRYSAPRITNAAAQRGTTSKRGVCHV